MSRVYFVIGVVSRPLVNGVFRLRVSGLEHIPREGGFVLAANHISNFDPWPLGMPLFPERQLRFMAKSELYWWPLGRLLDAGGAFPVRRGQHDTSAVETAVSLCRAGEAVVMFPEGTRRKKGLRKRWAPKAHTGAARIALAADVPLVPAAIAGTDRLSRLGPLRVAYGRPIAVDDLRELSASDAAAAATERLMDAIRSLEASL